MTGPAGGRRRGRSAPTRAHFPARAGDHRGRRWLSGRPVSWVGHQRRGQRPRQRRRCADGSIEPWCGDGAPKLGGWRGPRPGRGRSAPCSDRQGATAESSGDSAGSRAPPDLAVDDEKMVSGPRPRDIRDRSRRASQSRCHSGRACRRDSCRARPVPRPARARRRAARSGRPTGAVPFPLVHRRRRRWRTGLRLPTVQPSTSRNTLTIRLTT